MRGTEWILNIYLFNEREVIVQNAFLYAEMVVSLSFAQLLSVHLQIFSFLCPRHVKYGCVLFSAYQSYLTQPFMIYFVVCIGQ